MTTTIALLGTKFTEVSEDYDHDNEWARGDTSTQWDISAAVPIGLVENKEDILDTIDTNHTGECYLVYIIYSTGDSFGHDYSYFLELIWVFSSQYLAEKAAKQIYEHDRYDANVVLEIDFGIRKEFYPFWIGYFETLEQVKIIEVKVGK